MIFIRFYLEDGQFVASVDDSLINGIDRGQVDHLAQDDAIVHLLIHITPSILNTTLSQILVWRNFRGKSHSTTSKAILSFLKTLQASEKETKVISSYKGNFKGKCN